MLCMPIEKEMCSKGVCAANWHRGLVDLGMLSLTFISMVTVIQYVMYANCKGDVKIFPSPLKLF